MKGSVDMANLELSKLSQIEQLLNCLLALAKQTKLNHCYSKGTTKYPSNLSKYLEIMGENRT